LNDPWALPVTAGNSSQPKDSVNNMINLGQTRVSLEQRELFKDGAALRVGARAFDILHLLIRCQGRLVTKDEILQSVWPQTVVEENNLQVHISALRKALGEDRDLIRTIPGRGYVLLDEASPDSGDNCAEYPITRPMPINPSVAGSTPLIGREFLFNEVCQALSVCPLVTLTGPGGVGKTALATEVAHSFVATGSASVYVVSLAAVNGSGPMIEAVASVVGVNGPNDDAVPETLIHRLSEQTCLIVLDNCEHLIEAVADLAERLMHHCPGLTILATSREPLRIAHERSLRVPPLAVPEVGADWRSILKTPSVQLLSSQMNALDGSFAPPLGRAEADADLDTQSIELMAEVCRLLEGLPLALHMAAARACGLGLFELIASLGENLHLLSSGLRTAPSRHQSLQASLIWSLRLLDDDELAVLERLSQLHGRFTLDLACDAVQNRDLSRSRVLDCLVALALKSLLSVTAEGPFRFYAVPESTRAFIKCAQQDRSRASALAADVPHVGKQAPAMSFTTLHPGHSGPPGPSRYHTSHQRMLAASQ
jgi:predicted ATPase/DNA-binding winged helix-turn-helix (wHTH) protein